MEDLERCARMRQIVEDVEGLPDGAKTEFLELSAETSHERGAAEAAFSQWQSASGWTQHALARLYPESVRFLESVLSSARPAGYPFVARTAVVDALRCVLVDGLVPAPNPGVVPLLCGPVTGIART
ncbi:hypothetical protein [Gordonia alkanivorans]|uniref:hypothetical protein n=1 Tax=Gordonia alkanivorans TaxID=84096 RepID=UPI0004B9AA7E|nr:hypothetical protein [Gordonia alkanivorans]